MQFIPILPTKYQRFHYGIDHYMLSLAHLYSRDARYAQFFSKMHHTGHYVILDNAAYELPEPLSIGELWELLIFYGASELVLPDVMKDMHATGVATRDALDFLAQQPKEQLQRYLKQVMIVPQGNDILEWLTSLDDLLSALSTYLPEMPFTIGIAKHTHSYNGGRMKIIDYLLKNKRHHTDRVWDLHLLGIGEPLETLREIGISFGTVVRSVDSARPIIYANAGETVKLGKPLPELKRPNNYFNLDLGKNTWRMPTNISEYKWITSGEAYSWLK